MTDQRAQWNEEPIGASHATKTDTLNRLLGIEHNTDGTHRNVTTLPWLIDIDVFNTAASNTNWSTITMSATAIYNAFRISSGAQNDEITWPVVLAAGTWAVSLIHVKGSDRGIYSVQFDGVEKTTIDGYNAATVPNYRSYVSGITVSTTAKITLKLKMATKDSGSEYHGAIQHVRLIRVA